MTQAFSSIRTTGIYSKEAQNIVVLGLNGGVEKQLGVFGYNTGFLTNGATVSLDWLNNILSGNWSTNTVPITDIHLINRGYLTGVSGQLVNKAQLNSTSGIVLAQTVRTTGDQTVSGQKIFTNCVADILYSTVGGPYQLELANGLLYGGAGIPSINFSSSGRRLIDINNGFAALDWNFRYLINSSNSLKYDWENQVIYGAGVLTGNWTTNTNPTVDTHIINRGYLTGVSGVLASKVSEITKANSLFADISGSDILGTRERFDLPFKTLSGAVFRAVSGDTIFVNPGQYDLYSGIAKNGVNWFFNPGCRVYGHEIDIFDDLNLPIGYTVGGYGEFYGIESGNAASRIVRIQHSGTNVSFFAKTASTSATSEFGASVFLGVGNLDVTVDTLQTNAPDYCIWWLGLGHWRINAKSILSSSALGFAIGSLGVIDSDRMDVSCEYISGAGINILSAVSSHPNSSTWITAKEIFSSMSSITDSCVSCDAGKLYITTQKLSCPNGSPFSNGLQGQSAALLYINAQKIQGGKPALLFSGRADITVNQYLDSGIACNSAINIKGGTNRFYIESLEKTASGHGFDISGGTSYLEGHIATSAPNSYPILKNGGTLCLTNCVLVSSGTLPSISGLNGQAVKIQTSCSANNNVNANISLTPNAGFTVDSLIS